MQLWARANNRSSMSTEAVLRTMSRPRFLLPVVAFVLLIGAGIAVVAINPHVVHDHALSDVLLRAVVALLLPFAAWFVIRRMVQRSAREFARHSNQRIAGPLILALKLGSVTAVVAAELFIVGVKAGTLLLSGAAIAIVLALAAQQLLANVFAGGFLVASGVVTLGQRVRLQGGSLGGAFEGVISSFGLFHVTLTPVEGGAVLIPNSAFQQLVITPVRSPARVTVRARLPVSVSSGDLSLALTRSVKTLLLEPPAVTIDGADEDKRLLVTIDATPLVPGGREQLASEVNDVLGHLYASSETEPQS